MGSRFWASKPRLFWIAFVTVLMGYFAIYGGIETTKAFQTLESSKVLNQSGTQFLVGIPLSVEVGSNYSIRLEVKDSGDPAVIRGRVDFYADSSLVASRNWSWSEYGDEDDPFPQVSQIVQFVYDCTNPVTNFTIALAIEAGGSWNVLGYRNVSADIFNAPYYYAGFVMVGLFCLILTIPGWIGCYAGKRRPGTWDFLIAIFGSVITVCWGLLVAPEHPATFQTGVNILTFMIVYGIILTIAKLAIPKTPREFKPKPQEMKEVKYDPQKT